MVKNLRLTLLAKIAVVSLAFALPSYAQISGSAGRSGPSTSQDPCAVRTMEELQNAVCQLMARVNDLETELGQAQRDLLDAQGDIANLESDLAAAENNVATLQADLATATSRIDVLEANPVLALGPYVSVDNANINGLVGPHVLFTGANVHIQSGSGATDDGGAVTGLGNLIVGYNESSGDTRTGSHNLVIGWSHTFTSYAGIVAGFDNAITAQEASVLGGRQNTASGIRSTITGGLENVASGLQASITAGRLNIASGENSVVTAGQENQALSPGSCVTGGRFNIAGTDSTVGHWSVVSGGMDRYAPSTVSWAGGSLFELF